MNITDYILKDFSPLTLQSSIEEAQAMCKNFSLTHIPVLKDNVLVGNISQSDIQTIENKSSVLNNWSDLFFHFSANNSESILELITLFADNDTNIVPVTFEQKYIGYYELNDILDVFSQSPFLNLDGFILIVAKNTNDYSMSEIAQIVESNNAKLLGLYVSNQNIDTVEITLKISSQEINEIIQSFRRYNYTVITKHKDDFYLEELRNRSEYLQKFLNT